MKIEITEIEFTQILTGVKNYRHDCFIDNVLIASNCVQIKQEPIRVYMYFLELLIREWKTKYKIKYDKMYGENHKERYRKI